MIVDLNFNLNAWIKHLKVEADSEQDAINKLKSMTLDEIFSEAYLDTYSEFEVSDIDTTIDEYTLVVKVTDVEYDLDPEIMDISVIEYLKNFLPTEYTLTLEDVADSDDVEDLINDAIFHETNYDTKSFEFQIIEKKQIIELYISAKLYD